VPVSLLLLMSSWLLSHRVLASLMHPIVTLTARCYSQDCASIDKLSFQPDVIFACAITCIALYCITDIIS